MFQLFTFATAEFTYLTPWHDWRCALVDCYCHLVHVQVYKWNDFHSKLSFRLPFSLGKRTLRKRSKWSWPSRRNWSTWKRTLFSSRLASTIPSLVPRENSFAPSWKIAEVSPSPSHPKDPIPVSYNLWKPGWYHFSFLPLFEASAVTVTVYSIGQRKIVTLVKFVAFILVGGCWAPITRSFCRFTSDSRQMYLVIW